MEALQGDLDQCLIRTLEQAHAAMQAQKAASFRTGCGWQGHLAACLIPRGAASA